MTSCKEVDVENGYESLPYETGNHYCSSEDDCKSQACHQKVSVEVYWS